MLRRYSVPLEEEKADVQVIIDTDLGLLLILGTEVRCLHLFQEPDLVAFLLGESDFELARTLAGPEAFDAELTLKCIYEVLYRKRISYTGWRRFNEEKKLLEGYLPLDNSRFELWSKKTSLESPWQYRYTQPDPATYHFCLRVLPKLKAILKEEFGDAVRQEEPDK